MASKDIKESQQQSQGITIGTQGNEDITTPESTEVGHTKTNKEDRHIPNQERSSATNADKKENK